MTKQDLLNATIQVFENGHNLTPNLDYISIPPNIHLNGGWAYPQINAIDNPQLNRIPHPFVASLGGFEEGNFGFNTQLEMVLSQYNPNIFHNKKIVTPPHINYGNGNAAQNVNWEKPDIIETGIIGVNPPTYQGNIVLSSVQVGHNFVSQSVNGIFNKICHELWRLQQSFITNCFFIALYTHKQNLTPQEQAQLNIDYAIANVDSDSNYPMQLTIYRDDISRIDPNYIHLIFKGTRPSNFDTFFNVFIMELPQNFHFNIIQGNNGVRLRP